MKFRIIILFCFILVCTSFVYTQKGKTKYINTKESQSDIIDSTFSRKFNPFLKPLELIIDGAYYSTKNHKYTFGTIGLWSTVPEYNFVDGFWLGQTFKAKIEIDTTRFIEWYPMAYYTTARNKLIWQSEIVYNYSRKAKAQLRLKTGDFSADYDSDGHLDRFENTAYSLLFGANIIKFYRSRFIKLRNSYFFYKGFRFITDVSFERRTPEQNNILFCFFKTGCTSINEPKNPGFLFMPDSYALVTELGVDLTFSHSASQGDFYRELIYSDFPTLSIRYKTGIPVGNINRSSFQMVEIWLNQRFLLGANSTFDYNFGGGLFICKKNLYFPDFVHFGAYSLPTMRRFMEEESYYLLQYYKADTDRCWYKSAENFMSNKFLLTKIKPFNNQKFNEGLHFRLLWTPRYKFYTEWGYSLGYKNFARAGVFVGFNKISCKGVGVTISFPWLTAGN